MANIQFKSDNQNQSVLFPSRLDENIPAIHPVRIVNEIVDKLDIRDLLSEYKGGGTSAYHPRMLLKILIYGYLNNLYSSRRIAQQLTENIHFMWLSGRQTPDFRTINDFRSKRLKGRINALFTSVVQLMAEEGFVSLTTQYIDGTKLESASNRYTFVWRRSVETHKSRLEEKIRKVFDLIEQAITEDNTSALESELSGMSSTELRERLARLTSRLPQPSAPVKKACRELETKLLPKLQEYEEKLDICGERNSYSKTDHDATFMRMKEDHMKNGQLKPAYNVQISTENQIITHFGIYQRPGDTALLIPYLESFKQRYGLNDLCGHTVVADSGYGSEQNYEYMEQGGITAYVKYNYFHKEQKKAYVNNPFLPQNLVYNPDGDFIICPSGQKMNFTGTKNNISDLGYQSQSSLYQAENCQDCPLRTQCHKAKGNRVIELNHKLLAYRRRAKELLMSEEGLRHRSKRPVEVEAVFGQLKKNRMFNRFRMRGIKKVEIEFGLLAMAHNLLKMIKNRVKSCFLCIYTKNWNTFEENQTRKSSIKKKRERREKNTKKKTDRIFYFSVSLLKLPTEDGKIRLTDVTVTQNFIEIRQDLTDEWKRHGLQEGEHFATLTDIIYQSWAGKTAKEYKQFKGLKKENLRDNMTNKELVLNMLAELSTKEISEAQNPATFDDHMDIARRGGNVAKEARLRLEQETGKPVVTPLNAKHILGLDNGKPLSETEKTE